MSYKSAIRIIIALAALITYSAIAKDLPDGNRQSNVSTSSDITCQSQGSGRWRITGSAPGCCLALASGKCMFTCGPGSLRCEGGQASLPAGMFDLTNLPTEPDGTILLQTFCAGDIPGQQVLDPVTCTGGSTGNGARWTSVIGTCCPGSSASYSVTIDGVTRTSTVASCDAEPTVEDFATTTAGLKSYSARLTASACPDFSLDDSVTFAANTCYIFSTQIQGQGIATTITPVNCPSAASAASADTLDRQMTPMAIYPLYPDEDTTGLDSYQQIQPRSPSLE